MEVEEEVEAEVGVESYKSEVMPCFRWLPGGPSRAKVGLAISKKRCK